MMLKYNEIVKVMTEKSFGSDVRKLIQDAEKKLMEIIEVPDDEINDLQEIGFFAFSYNMENNTLVFEAEPNSEELPFCKDETHPTEEDVEIFKALSEFLEKNYTKKLYSFGIAFYVDENLEFERDIEIYVKQKKLNEAFFEGMHEHPKKYYGRKYIELREFMSKLNVAVIDLCESASWSDEYLVE